VLLLLLLALLLLLLLLLLGLLAQPLALPLGELLCGHLKERAAIQHLGPLLGTSLVHVGACLLQLPKLPLRILVI
jgi:hypothetical protein